MKRVAVILAFFGVAASPAPAPTVADTINGYLKLVRMTEQPRSNIYVLASCTFESSASLGPHVYEEAHFYMDSKARESFEKSAPYPVGSVIVKEKGVSLDRTKAPPIVDVAGMIKRRSSTPPSVTDWEFFYADERRNQAPVSALRKCADCHANASKTDFVFGDWSKPRT